MSGYFAPLSRFPFTWEITGRLAVTDAGDSLDVSGVRDASRANTLMVSNAGPNACIVNVGDAGVGTTFPTAGMLDGEGIVVLAGAIVTMPCPPLPDATVVVITDSGETADVFISRGWGQ